MKLTRAVRLVVALVAAGCATPSVPWPPAPTAPARTVLVSVDTWHAMIALPLDGSDAPGPDSAARHGAPGARPLFEEWGYAERAWYLEGRQGFTGALRALFWPSAGVVEVTVTDRAWAERTPQPPAEVFPVPVSDEGLRRLRRHLEATRAATDPVVIIGPSRFYPARDAYHLFHQCHQYAARALREAGLPLSVVGAFSRSSFAWQLRRATAAALQG